MMINTGDGGLHVVGAVGEEGAILGEAVKEVEAAPVPTEVHYSWHYYEREDQVEELFDSLNIKGMRERKLQENLRKVKERLKLKKAKKVATKPVPEEATQLLPDMVLPIYTYICFDGSSVLLNALLSLEPIWLRV